MEVKGEGAKLGYYQDCQMEVKGEEAKLGYYQNEDFIRDVILADDITLEQAFTVEEEERMHDIMRELMEEIGIQAAPFKPQYQEAEPGIAPSDLRFLEEISSHSANKLSTSEKNISAESSSPQSLALPDEDDQLWQLDEWNIDQDISCFTEIDDDWMLGTSLDSKIWSVDEQRAWERI